MLRSLFVQAASLSDADLTAMLGRVKNDAEVENVVMDVWDPYKVNLAKSVLPYNPSGPYKHLFVGNPQPTTYDYQAILDGTWRWNNLMAAEAAAREALPYADGWYISYETGINVFESESFRWPWEWYLGDMVRRLRSVKDVPIIWSPYLYGPYKSAAVAGFARAVRSVLSWYSPGAQFEIHVQDGVGSDFQTQAGALLWGKALKIASGMTVKMNVEWFDAPAYAPADGRPREAYYLASGMPVGACWELRYYDAVKLATAFPLNAFRTYENVGTVCVGKAQTGTKNLLAAINGQWDASFSYGIYNCRKVAGTNTLSVHAEGRALDVGYPVVDGKAHSQGYDLLATLRRNAWPLGLQMIIWDRKSYSRRYPSGRTYTGVNPHIDHLHIEQTWEGARTLDLNAAWHLTGRGTI